MDAEFDDIFLHWRNQFEDALCSKGNIPVDGTSVESFLDDILEIEEDGVMVALVGAELPGLPSSTDHIVFRPCTANASEPMSYPSWPSDGNLLQTDVTDAQVPGTGPAQVDHFCDLVSNSPASTSSPGSVSTSVSSGARRRQRGPSGTDPSSPCAKRKLQSGARVSQKRVKSNDLQKPVKQSKERTGLPALEEHILRERRRRHDMAAKFLVLDTLLPPAIPKREKAVIVEDTIQLVKSLQSRKQELVKRRAHLKLTSLIRDSEASPHRRSITIPKQQHDPSHQGPSWKQQPMQVLTSQSGSQLTPPSTSDRGSIRKLIMDSTTAPTTMRQYSAQKLVAAAAHSSVATKMDTISARGALQIHAQVSEDEILVEVCLHRYPANLQTRLIQTVESVRLEVVRCCVHRVPCGFVECVITAKPRLVDSSFQSRRHDTLSSATVLIGALQAAFRHV